MAIKLVGIILDLPIVQLAGNNLALLINGSTNKCYFCTIIEKLGYK